MNTFINDIFRVGISNGLIILFSLLSSIITARYLGPDKNGIIAGLLVYPSLFMSIGSLGIRQSTTYFLGKNIYSEEKIKTAITQIWLFTTIFSITSCFLLMYFFSNSGYNLLLILLALIPIPFTLFNTYNSGIFLGKNDIKTFNQINWIPAFITLLATFFLVILLKLDISGAMLALIGGPIFISLILLFKNKFINSFSLAFNWKVIKDMLSLGIVYAIALLVINLNYRIDIIFLDRLSTPLEMGLYAKGATFSQFLWQIPMVLSTIVFARSATAKNDIEFSKKTTQLLRISFIAVTMVSFIIYLLSDIIIITMYGEEFRKSIDVLNILLPGVVILTIFKVMNMDLAGRGKPWISMKAMIPALIINIILNLVLIPKFGAYGASISSTSSYSVAGILFLYFYSKETQIKIKDIITYKKTDFIPIMNIIKRNRKQ